MGPAHLPTSHVLETVLDRQDKKSPMEKKDAFTNFDSDFEKTRTNQLFSLLQIK